MQRFWNVIYYGLMAAVVLGVLVAGLFAIGYLTLDIPKFWG